MGAPKQEVKLKPSAARFSIRCLCNADIPLGRDDFPTGTTDTTQPMATAPRVLRTRRVCAADGGIRAFVEMPVVRCPHSFGSSRVGGHRALLTFGHVSGSLGGGCIFDSLFVPVGISLIRMPSALPLPYSCFVTNSEVGSARNVRRHELSSPTPWSFHTRFPEHGSPQARDSTIQVLCVSWWTIRHSLTFGCAPFHPQRIRGCAPFHPQRIGVTGTGEKQIMCLVYLMPT